MKMKYLISLIVVTFLSTGCSSKICKPLTAFDTIVISPFKADTTFVEEAKYRKLPLDIAIATASQLKGLLEDSKMFNKAIQSSECVDRAIKIDGMIFSLIHKKGKFRVQTSGEIINCQNGEILNTFDNSNNDSESVKLPHKIAEEVSDGIINLLCVESN